MRKLLLAIGALAIVAVLLTTAFLAIGGGQMINGMRGPKLPSQVTASTPTGDLEYLRQVVLNNEGGISNALLDQFQKIIRSVSANPAIDQDAASIVAARAMAVLANAHSTLTDPRLHRLPIRVHWFADGLFVVKTRPEWANLVGSKIVDIGGKSPEQLLDHVSEIAAGNESWKKYRSEYFMVAPAAIAFLGGEVKEDVVILTTMNSTGAESFVSLKADPDVLPGDAFWEWENQLPGDQSFKTNGWKTLLTTDPPLPLYLQESQKLFLLRDLPQHDAVYVRMNGSINDDNMPIGRFGEESLTLIRNSHRTNAIVDFRFNWGGGYEGTVKFTRNLPNYMPPNGRIYLITGPNTFSAGLIAAARLKHFAGDKIVLVGKPAGDELQFRAEGFLIKLPVTGIRAYVSTARHDFQHRIGWFSDCYFLDKFYGVAIDSIAPSIDIENTSESYSNGRDEVVEAIFSRIKSQPR
jgi:hypothetical protein